jgi:hypothetical protein
LFWSDQVQSKVKCIEPGPTQLKKLILILILIFNCILFKKIRKRLLDDVAFAEFDRNPNFIPDDILYNVVARLKNQENCSSCRMNFIYDKIIDSLME